MKKNRKLVYSFYLEGDQKEVFVLELDPATLEVVDKISTPLPDWTRLEYHQCPHCPLQAVGHSHCPLAASIAGVVKQFQHIISYDEIFLQVETNERMTTQKTTTQRALSSFMGVVMAVSGCPHTSFFKPMARFHLPLASEEETIYRSTSMYLLAQYFRLREGFAPDFSLTGLNNIYKNIQTVNSSIIERLRKASTADSSTNAIIILDMYARIMPYVIEDALEDIRYLFTPYMN